MVLGACHSECKAFANKKETKQLETKEKKITPRKIKTFYRTNYTVLGADTHNGSWLRAGPPYSRYCAFTLLSSNYMMSTGAK